MNEVLNKTKNNKLWLLFVRREHLLIKNHFHLVIASSKEKAAEGLNKIYYNETGKIKRIECIEDFHNTDRLLYDIILDASKKIIYFDYQLNEWVLKKYDKPNTEIFNLIYVEKTNLLFINEKDMKITDDMMDTILLHSFINKNTVCDKKYLKSEKNLDIVLDTKKANLQNYTGNKEHTVIILPTENMSINYLQKLKLYAEKFGSKLSNKLSDIRYNCSIYLISEDSLYYVPLGYSLALQKVS